MLLFNQLLFLLKYEALLQQCLYVGRNYSRLIFPDV
jgi:hypothetical protein